VSRTSTALRVVSDRILQHSVEEGAKEWGSPDAIGKSTAVTTRSHYHASSQSAPEPRMNL
jgi:hypothetical protein